MQDELVEQKKWLSSDRFTELLGLTNLIPGPNSTEMAMLCGYARGGFWGFVLAGLSFIFPAFLLTALAAILYLEYKDISWVTPLVDGMKPAVILVILLAVWKLGKKSLKNNIHYGLFVLTVAANYFFISEISAIFICAFLYTIWKKNPGRIMSLAPLGLLPWTVTPLSLKAGPIFWVFLKIGCVLFGSGYVLVAYLDSFLVQDLQWIDRTVLLDSIAIGQFTPGPVLTTASFVGYYLGSWPGALAATIGIFLPSFVFVAFLYPFVEKIRKYEVVRYIIEGAGIGALAVMVVVSLRLLIDPQNTWSFFVILGLLSVLTYFKTLPSYVIILLGMLLGAGLYFMV